MYSCFFNKEYIILFINFCLIFLFFFFLELLTLGCVNYNYIEIFIASSIAVNITSYLFLKKSYYKYFVIIFLFFISVLYIKIITQSNINYSNVKYILAFYTGITNIFLLLFCYKKLKFLRYTIQIILLFPTLFIWQYFFISDNFVNIDTVLAIFQTNFSEAKSYIYDFIGVKQLISFLVLMFISFFILKCNNKLNLNNISNKKISAILIISICLNIFLIFRYKDNIVTQIAIDTVKSLKEYKDFKKLVSERKVSDIKFDDKTKINKGVYVLVIGESQNKKHMSAYGYKKETTPWLKSMEKDKNFIKFENVYSCHTHTVPVLSYALTSKNQYNNFDLSKTISILDAAKALDIQTVWLSNQVHYGGWDTPISVIADTAQQQKWINNNFGESYDTTFYDIKLINELKKITIYDDMLIVIHLMGSHGLYKDRYPKEFDIFKDENAKIAQYDNSILYNDYVVKNIFETIKEIPNFKALIYCADHADAVDQDLSHDVSQFVPDMTYIPLYVYLSDSYIKNNQQTYINLCNNKNCYWTNDLLFNLLCGILNIKIFDIYEQENNIADINYNNDINRFKTLHGKTNI